MTLFLSLFLPPIGTNVGYIWEMAGSLGDSRKNINESAELKLRVQKML